MQLPNKLQNLQTVTVEPWEFNNDIKWPSPATVNVKNGNIRLTITTNNPINLGKEVKKCKIFTTELPTEHDEEYYQVVASNNSIGNNHSVPIATDRIECEEAKLLINKAHEEFAMIFNKDLSRGYNNFYGKQECGLNWASTERPSATKVHTPSYDHDLKVLQQELMDDLTSQNVLIIPQEHDIEVQAICPSFIQRKQRAKQKPKQDLTKEDVRLLINFGSINELIKPIPNHVPKIGDVLITLGRWRHIICLDLYNGYFQ